MSILPGRGHVFFKCTFPSKYIASDINLARVDDDHWDYKNRYSREDTLFGRKQGSLIAYTWPFYYRRFWQQGYYKCVLKTAHGDIVSSRKVFVLVEGTFHSEYLACVIDSVKMLACVQPLLSLLHCGQQRLHAGYQNV